MIKTLSLKKVVRSFSNEQAYILAYHDYADEMQALCKERIKNLSDEDKENLGAIIREKFFEETAKSKDKKV